MNFELYRNLDDSLNLQEIFATTYAGESAQWLAVGLNYILQIEALSKIKSKQIAAVIIIQAAELANLKYPN
jgi:hypothetical protein